MDVHVWLGPAVGDPRGAAHGLLLDLATDLLGTTPALRHAPSGRPVLPGLAVSISHTPHLTAVAAAVPPHDPAATVPSYDPAATVVPLGVDLEERSVRAYESLAHRWFGPEELTWMHTQADPFDAFLHLWTAKEAIGKALGTGLRGGGLRRRVPLPQPSPDQPAGADPIDGLVVTYPRLTADAVLAVAVPVDTQVVLVTEHHGAAFRRTVTSRTSSPVVVRGN